MIDEVKEKPHICFSAPPAGWLKIEKQVNNESENNFKVKIV